MSSATESESSMMASSDAWLLKSDSSPSMAEAITSSSIAKRARYFRFFEILRSKNKKTRKKERRLSQRSII